LCSFFCSSATAVRLSFHRGGVLLLLLLLLVSLSNKPFLSADAEKLTDTLNQKRRQVQTNK
jgi:hypothetical protein